MAKELNEETGFKVSIKTLIGIGFAITTMTTYNNPYFDGESNNVNIIVWYFSLSNNIINLVLEK